MREVRRRLVLDLLGETPVDDTSLADFKQRCDDLTRRLFPTANPRMIPHRSAPRKEARRMYMATAEGIW